VGFRAGLDTHARGKTGCLCRGSNPVRPVRSQTLYCLNYLSSYSSGQDLKSIFQFNLHLLPTAYQLSINLVTGVNIKLRNEQTNHTKRIFEEI
jgi:hypothetical protein